MSRIAEAMLPEFAGHTYSAAKDGKRLTGLLNSVKYIMQDGQWRTLAQIVLLAGGSEAGVSARLRDLRKAKFGGYTVDHRRLSNGLWEYRINSEARSKTAR